MQVKRGCSFGLFAWLFGSRVRILYLGFPAAFLNEFNAFTITKLISNGNWSFFL